MLVTGAKGVDEIQLLRMLVQMLQMTESAGSDSAVNGLCGQYHRAQQQRAGEQVEPE